MHKSTGLGTLLLTTLLFTSPAAAATLTNLVFNSNAGSYQNDTIINGASPLAFTLTGATTNPFLNASNSTVSLGYGAYFAIAPLGFGQHVGAGNISFLLDGSSSFTQAVTFPSVSPAGVVFATFNLPGGDQVQFQTTGITADRTRVSVDGSGLVPDGELDAFYLLTYSSGSANSAVPEPSTIGISLLGLAAVAWRARQK